jgi:hypothetical protein
VTTGDRPGSGPSADATRRLQEAAERLMSGWATAAGISVPGGAPTPPGPPAPPVMPTLPATMSAGQFETFLADLADRHAQVQALCARLEAFDGHLAALEASVRPMVEWTLAWADWEKSMGQFWRPPGPP